MWNAEKRTTKQRMGNMVKMPHIASTFKSSSDTTSFGFHPPPHSVNSFQTSRHRTPRSGIYRPHTTTIPTHLGINAHYITTEKWFAVTCCLATWEEGMRKRVDTHNYLSHHRSTGSHYLCFHSRICCEKVLSVALKAGLCIIGAS